MREKGFNFGGESSGHLIFLDHGTTGDGLIAALQILALMKRRVSTLSQAISRYSPYPQIVTSVRVRQQAQLSLYPDIQEMIRAYEKSLGAGGRLLVRYSGTEPVVRIMIEGREESTIRRMAKDLSSCIEHNLK
jgi:phosphoglucosamine mutase